MAPRAISRACSCKAFCSGVSVKSIAITLPPSACSPFTFSLPSSLHPFGAVHFHEQLDHVLRRPWLSGSCVGIPSYKLLCQTSVLSSFRFRDRGADLNALLRCLQNKTPPQAVLRLRGRLKLWCTFDCAGGGPGDMVGHPGFISEPPIEGLSIVEAGGWCQEPAPFPVLVASRPPSPCEDYNYKSSRPVTGCNLHRGLWL